MIIDDSGLNMTTEPSMLQTSVTTGRYKYSLAMVRYDLSWIEVMHNQ